MNDDMPTEEIIELNYQKERVAFQRRHFKFAYCPASVLLGCACTGCPLKGACAKCNPGSLLGVDHQTITKDSEGNSRFTFRPYRASLGERQKENLHAFCGYFKLKLEISDEVTYEKNTYTVYITPTEDSLCFRKGGRVLGQPWYGKDSPHHRYRVKMKR